MTERDEAVRLAQAAVSVPTWGVAEQFLAVHDIVVDDSGPPSVAHVDVDSEPGADFVYFAVRDEPYYFVVVIRPEGSRQLAVSAMYVKARVRVYLRISSATLSALRHGHRAPPGHPRRRN